jgi:hypothetical protein
MGFEVRLEKRCARRRTRPGANKKSCRSGWIFLFWMVSGNKSIKILPLGTGMDARFRFEEYLEKECPIILQLLEPAGRALDKKCLFYQFMPRHRQYFENLSNSPLVDSLARAATQIKLDIRITINDLKTGFQHEILIRRTANGIEALRNIKDRKPDDSATEGTDWLRPVIYT